MLLLTGLAAKLHDYAGDENLAIFGGALMAVPILLMSHVPVRQPRCPLAPPCLLAPASRAAAVRGSARWIFFI